MPPPLLACQQVMSSINIPSAIYVSITYAWGPRSVQMRCDVLPTCVYAHPTPTPTRAAYSSLLTVKLAPRPAVQSMHRLPRQDETSSSLSSESARQSRGRSRSRNRRAKPTEDSVAAEAAAAVAAAAESHRRHVTRVESIRQFLLHGPRPPPDAPLHHPLDGFLHHQHHLPLQLAAEPLQQQQQQCSCKHVAFQPQRRAKSTERINLVPAGYLIPAFPQDAFR